MASDKIAVGSLQVEIEQECALPEDTAICHVGIELDDEYNSGRTCFGLGESAYVKVYSNTTPAVYSTGVDPSIRAQNIGEAIIETVLIANAKGQTTKPIYNLVAHRWIGKIPPNIGVIPIRYIGKTTHVYLAGYGEEEPPEDLPEVPDNNPKLYYVVELQYQTRFSRYRAVSHHDGPIQVYAVGAKDDSTYGDCSKTVASVQIDFSIECIVGTKTVTVVAKDAISGNTIEDASVWVNNEYRGKTDSHGRLSIGILAVGEHSIKITADGYQATDADGLANDLFKVTE